MEKKKNLFYVKGEPFIALAGEAHNSSSSTAYFMESVWEKAQEQGMNTLAAGDREPGLRAAGGAGGGNL